MSKITFPPIRQISSLERIQIDAKVTVQFAMKLKSPKFMDNVLNKVSKYCIGLHSHVEKKMIHVNVKSDVNVYRLPNNFKSLEDACKYMLKNHHLSYDRALGTVGANSDTIVLNLCHLAADGVYLLNLFNALKDSNEIEVPNFITNNEAALKDEIDNASDPSVYSSVACEQCRIMPRDLINLSQYQNTRSYVNHSCAADLQTYNRQTQKLSGLSDALWAFLILSTSAHNGKDFTNQVISTQVNMRPFIKQRNVLANTNHFSTIYLESQATKDTTIQEMMKQLREDFKTRMKTDEVFSYLKSFKTNNIITNQLPGVTVDVSNVGRFQLDGPFENVWIHSDMLAGLDPNRASFISFSVDGNGRNDVYTTTRYCSSAISEREIELVSKSLHYGMEKIPLNTTCGEALDILEDYQKSLEKDWVQAQVIKME